MTTALTLAMCLLGASPAQAETLRDRNTEESTSSAAQRTLPFATWTDFSVGATGSTSETLTFFSRTPVLLRVTDGLCRGDKFRVLDRGFALFNTSRVGTDPTCDDTPLGAGQEAWLDQSYSKGRFLLQPGSHTVRIRITDSPFGGASGFIRIDRRPVR